ncbi:ADP-ribosylglycohydrolase [Rhodobacterales bacterium 56_14_T64]|nr:ADP-ribosylglycohydrolase [Rhodobacterales bacterium 56_14_T64]
MSVRTSNLVSTYDVREFERVVVNSALWSAAGDALGWMTELSRGTSGVKHRTGVNFVKEPLAWKRLIGGRSGVSIDLPTGTYSDDTQLRLAVSRAIRGNGDFDVEAFAKVEVTVWQGYGLGAGIGSKAAATNLSKRGVNWFSNFFKTDRQTYTNAGGNGAAMRIQPHVWSSQSSIDEMVKRVLRDALVTHGHPHGFCGAVFHALCLWATIQDRKIPSLAEARHFISNMQSIPKLIAEDSELSSFWLPTWEREAGVDLESSLQRFCIEAEHDLKLVENVLAHGGRDQYHHVLRELGCLTDRFRGSGFKTSLAALAQASLHSGGDVEKALIEAANELESDTDTIATMIGALLGALSPRPPSWTVQDTRYIEKEAVRLARVAFREQQESFAYPDISEWSPPGSQSDSVVQLGSSLALVGFGPMKAKGKEYSSRGSTWQWFETTHGQTILAKRRTRLVGKAAKSQFPNVGRSQSPKAPREIDRAVQQDRLNFEDRKLPPDRPVRNTKHKPEEQVSTFPGLDLASQEAISSGFDDATIGRLFNQCIQETRSLEQAVGFAAIVAKAKLVRGRRN